MALCFLDSTRKMSGATVLSFSFPPREHSQPAYKPTIDIYSLIHSSTTDRTVRNQNSNTTPKKDICISPEIKQEMTIILREIAKIPTMLDQKPDEDCGLARSSNEEEDEEEEEEDNPEDVEEEDTDDYFEYSNEHDDIVFDDDEPQLKQSRSLQDDIEFEISFEDIGHEIQDIEDDVVEIPEWFSHEDKDQLKEIFHMYIEALDLDQVKRVREPPKFVGRVKRTVVESDDGKFRTLDSVDVFRRSLLPPGSAMPHVKTFNVLTCWSFEEGLPIDIRKLTKSQKKYWYDRVIEEPPSFLMCLPVFSNDSEYEYSVSENALDVRHSPSSYSHHSYDQYIPKRSLSSRAKLLMSPTSLMFGDDNS